MSGDNDEVRKFYLGGYIDNDTAEVIITNLIEADTEDPTAFWEIFMNSEGGDIEPGSAIYDVIRGFSERGNGAHYITMYMVGQCCSMATLISQAADWRVTTPLTQWMFHDLTTEMIGKTTRTIREECTMMDAWADLADSLMLERTELTMEKFRTFIDGHDWWVRGEALLSFGFVDEIA